MDDPLNDPNPARSREAWAAYRTALSALTPEQRDARHRQRLAAMTPDQIAEMEALNAKFAGKADA